MTIELNTDKEGAKLHFKIDSPSQTSILLVRNILGRKVIVSELSSDFFVDISSFPHGPYFIQIPLDEENHKIYRNKVEI